MTIFLTILGILGKVILIALLVIVAGLVLLPVVYRVRITKSEDFVLKGTVRWLFGFLYVSFGLTGAEKKFIWDIRILGISLRKLLEKPKDGNKKKKKKKKKRKKKKAGPEYTEAAKKPTIPSRRVTTDYVWEKGVEPEFFEEEELSGFEKAARKLKEKREKFSLTFENICAKLDKAKEAMQAFGTIKPLVMNLLQHIRPRKIKGFLIFGFDSPANTGMLTGLLGCFLGWIPEKLEITPDFTQKRLECDVRIAGRIFIVYTVIQAVKILKTPEIKKLLKSRK